MTEHIHDPAAPGGAGPDPATTTLISTPAARPRWLLPGVAGAIVVGGLVVAGVVSLSTVLYAGMLGGMLLMHAGGHGPGGHDGGGDAEHLGARPPETTNLRQGSSGTQPRQAESAVGLDTRADDDLMRSETRDHDQHSSHGCH